jgi:diphthamide synthase (EF-2-diphthine--ammonia ligase)
MRSLIAKAQEIGVEAFAFGDLFLTEIRAYRERQLAGTGIEPIFPIWGIPTQGLARAMICAGVRARLSCVDPKQISASFVGREFDENLLDELPAHADPCGENGEFHTFVYAGPMLRREVRIVSGETVTRDGFVYADLMLAQSTASSQAIA